jgi:glyoxylate/hydroxypyruvate reductase A
MRSVVIRVDPERRAWWKATLSDQLPGFSIYLWDEDQFDPAAIDYFVTWMPPMGAVASLPNLKAVFSVGAGVAHILRDPDYPTKVPIVRTISEDLRMRMTEYVILHVLRYHRRLPEIERAHADARWTQYVEPLAREITVGLLGVGNLGRAVARGLREIGYSVKGWSRRGRPTDGVEIFSGEDGLIHVLSSSKIVVGLLPGTVATADLIDRKRLGAMQPGSFLINVGRGELIVDADLLTALASGHIGGATLDVFRKEPLEPTDPYWTAPNVLITSHTASAIEPATGGKVISSNILAFDRGERLADIVDIEQGY